MSRRRSVLDLRLRCRRIFGMAWVGGFRAVIGVSCFAGFFVTRADVSAHPAAAQPVDYPFVIGFERFYASDDDPEYLAEGGRLLLNELNCVACHAPPAAWRDPLSGRPGTSLNWVSERLEPSDLGLMIRNPRFVKRGTLMPSLFVGADRNPEEVVALRAFLSSLKEPADEGGRGAEGRSATGHEGDIDRGRALFHQVGCVACHAPEKNFVPEGLPEGTELELVGLPSVPMDLVDRYPRNVVEALLRDPSHFRPSGRMPDLHLNDEEIADLAVYLQSGDELSTPPELLEAMASEFDVDEAQATDAEWVERGRRLFSEKNCVACHADTPGVEPPAVSPPALIELEWKEPAGCLAENPPGGLVPWYYLDAVQRKALALALESLAQIDPPEAEGRVDFALSRLNCYACHDRAGKGGPESAREPYFTSSQPGALSLGRWGLLPPPLDHVGRKLTPAWLDRVLKGEDGGVRPYLRTRMPRFASAALGSLEDDFVEADPPNAEIEIDVTGFPRHQRAHFGRDLIGIPPKGLGCVTCHGLKDAPSLGAPVVPLTHTAERLQPAYFKQLLLDPQSLQPGTLMPPLFAGRQKADHEIEQLWTYLKELDQQRLPDGLLRTEAYEVKPQEAGRPIVFRTFLEGAGTRAIAVGFPERVHLAFDALNCRWALVWKGDFVDAMSTWEDRYCAPAKPLGEPVRPFPEGLGIALAGVESRAAARPDFAGFELDGKGVPAMLYGWQGYQFADRIRPVEGGLIRELRIEGKPGKLQVRGLALVEEGTESDVEKQGSDATDGWQTVTIGEAGFVVIEQRMNWR